MARWNYHNTVRVLGVALSLAIAYAFALLNIRSYFAWYDDEGFMLMTLRQYISGLPLYDKMYTEYGPFYYVFQSALFRTAGWSVTHDQVRGLTIFLWLAIACAWAICVWQWSRSTFWGITALLATIVALRLLNREPGHPQTLVLLLYGFSFLVVNAYRRLPNSLIFGALGGAGAALTLTKINVGIFMCAALAAVLVSYLPDDLLSRMVGAVVRASCIALPAVLMNRHFRFPSAVIQCAVYTFGIWTTLYVLKRNARPELSWSAIFWGAVGFVVVACGTIAAVLLHGTSLSGLVNGMFLVPLRFSRGVGFQAISETPTLIASLGISSMLFYARTRLDLRSFSKLQAVVAATVIVLTLVSPPMGTSIAPSVAFMFLPNAGKAKSKFDFRLPMTFVAVAACLSLLMAYPVTGTQLSVAACIVLLAAFGALLQGLCQSVPDIAPSGSGFARWEWVLGGLTLLATIGIGARTVMARPVSAISSMHLPNSQLIELPTEDYAVYSELTAKVSSHCDALVTIPGMNSFHIWSGLPHPNGFIVSSTMVLFDSATQDRLKKDFLAARRPCVIFNPNLMVWGASFRPMRKDQPFIDLITSELVPVYSRRGYEVRVPSAQVVAWQN